MHITLPASGEGAGGHLRSSLLMSHCCVRAGKESKLGGGRGGRRTWTERGGEGGGGGGGKEQRQGRSRGMDGEEGMEKGASGSEY